MANSKKQENPILITQTDEYIFAQGNHYEIYNKFLLQLLFLSQKENQEENSCCYNAGSW